MSVSLKSLCDEFWQKARDAYIFYLDAFKGLECLREDMVAKQNAIIEKERKVDPRYATVEYTDQNTSVPYIKQHDTPLELHGLLETTLGEFKKRNAEDGANFQMLGNLCLVAIYSWWEDHYRAKLAAYLNKPKNDIKSAVMGDICALRNAIIHNNGVATTDVENAEILKWFKRGTPILLTFERFEQILTEIQLFLQVFYQKSLLIG